MIETGSHHLIATHTVMRKAGATKAGPPQIIRSGTFDECYEHAMTQIGGRSWHPNSPELAANGLPVFATNDWTYYIVQGRTL